MIAITMLLCELEKDGVETVFTHIDLNKFWNKFTRFYLKKVEKLFSTVCQKHFIQFALKYIF